MSDAKSPHHLTEKLDGLYEFDREPVPQSKLYRGLHFAGLYAGEHTAATEFVIGALFVSWGASVFDIFVGLLLGNLLAVLSWTLFCAPIAVQTRLTLYWYIRRIGGSFFAFFYNICNALLYCVLAGTMITVSASAVRIPFGIPSQTTWYPTDVRFVFIVLLVGAVIIALAILGFKRLVLFSSVCAPWMLAMFVAGALVMLPVLSNASGFGEIRSFSQFWQIAEKMVWTGKAVDANNQIGFLHVMTFAWICNLAMHIGLSDMAAFRYAKKSYYGLHTWTGMFLGHYLAWICAGILGAGAAIALNAPLAELDSGAIGYAALGFCGAIAVVLAGWTTANPTLYKAGLAFQAVTPNWPRWAVTLVAGTVTTIIACFPFVFAEMLNFIGLYGLLLVPVGAIVFMEHWVFPKIGITRYWAHHKGVTNWPAVITWITGIVVAMVAWKTGFMHLFFLFMPIWFVTAMLYVVLAVLFGARSVETNSVGEAEFQPISVTASVNGSDNSDSIFQKKKSLTTGTVGVVALISLAACLGLPLWIYVADIENFDQNLIVFKQRLLWVTIIYFVSSTTWVVKREK